MEDLLSMGWLGGFAYLSALFLLDRNFYRPGAERSSIGFLAVVSAGLVSHLLLEVDGGCSGCTIGVFAALGMAPDPQGRELLYRSGHAE